MPTIIEREIAKREAIIVEKADKEAILAELEARVKALKVDIANTDVTELQAEIDELKTYLPKPEISEVEVAAEATEPIENAPASPEVLNSITL